MENQNKTELNEDGKQVRHEMQVKLINSLGMKGGKQNEPKIQNKKE